MMDGCQCATDCNHAEKKNCLRLDLGKSWGNNVPGQCRDDIPAADFCTSRLGSATG